MRMLQHVYYWQDRLYRMIEANESAWFDDVDTEAVETRDELFYLAALDAIDELSVTLGRNPQEWRWGRVHTVTFFSPIIPGEAAAAILGAGTHPMFGSTETINRGKFNFNDPYAATYIDSMRFVADLSDPDKVMAVLAGGVSGRQFDPHLKDQVEPWLSGEPHYLWFSDEAIEEHAQSALLLTP
jgi:penicillin amidase